MLELGLCQNAPKRRSGDSKSGARYNRAMANLIDQIALLATCALFGTLGDNNPFVVVGFLAAVVLVGVDGLAPFPGRVAVQCAFYIASLFAPSILLFLPVVAYEAMHERPWVARFLWLAPWVAAPVLSTAGVSVLAFSGVLCLVAALLAVRDVREGSEREGLRFSYDDLRERFIALADEAQKRSQPEDADVSFEAAAPQGESVFADLTEREMAVVRMVAEGMDNREIAASLYLSEGTVRNHISSVLAKKHLSNRTQIAIAYLSADQSA